MIEKDMIKFTEFIKPPNPNKTKVKFNMHAGDIEKRAWDLLLEEDEEWIRMNQYKTKHPNNNLNHANYLIAFAQYYPYGSEYFMFGGMYKVKKKIPEVYDTYGYDLTLMDDFLEYRKRLIIKLEKPIGRDVYNRKYETIQEQLNPEIYELSPNTKLGTFPGYQNVSLTHKELQQIISRDEPSWKQALSYVKGIYVITDTITGKLYIGSASGNTDGIWQRWHGYADVRNLSNSNKEFDNILKNKSANYIIDNFKYSILEIFDTKTKVETVLEREGYWKRVFVTRKHGMNHN